jgi:2-keto-3-deoxy-6-phosphogluconate aldolase
MPTKAEIIERLVNPGIIVVRAHKADQVPRSEAAAGGSNLIEITMTTPNAPTADPREAQNRLACFIESEQCSIQKLAVAPSCWGRIRRHAHLPRGFAKSASPRAIIGRLCTPTEAQLAYEAGADFIKLFQLGNLVQLYNVAPVASSEDCPDGGVELTM